MKTKIAKTKTWIKEHRFELTLGVLTSATVVGLSYLSVKEQQFQIAFQKKLSEFIMEENSKGRSVFQLANGDYISVKMDKQ